MSDVQADRGEREARIRERKIRNRITATRKGGLTLYTGCERAIDDLDYLLKRVERYREALEETVDEVEAAVRRGIIPAGAVNLWKAHRALNEGEDDG